MKNKKAFTIMEVMISVVIVSIFAAVALPQFFWSVERVKAAEAINLSKAIWVAREAYREEHGVYPSNMSQLDVDIPRVSGWNTPYLCSGGYVVGMSKSGYPYTWIKMSPKGKVGCYGYDVCPRLGLPYYWENQ